MEDFSFDVQGLLTDEEAEKFFSEDNGQKEDDGGDASMLKEVPDTIAVEDTEKEIDNPDAEELEEQAPEIVGEGKNEVNEEDEDAGSEDAGASSPNVFYSSIASALKNDGIFSDLDDDTIKKVQGPEDFAELFEKELQSRLDDRQKRIDDALRSGVQPDTVRQFEGTLQYLNSIDESAITAEGDEGDALRKQLIYNDYLMRGYTSDRAAREVEKSFKSASEIEDAKDALAGLKAHYENEYAAIQNNAKKMQEERVAQQKKASADFKKMVLDSEVVLGDQKLDARTRQKIYDSVTKPIYKDESTGRLLTAVQKYQQDNPLEFLKQLGLWYVLTDGGKDMVGFTKGKVRSEKHKAMRELENKLKATSLNSDGTLRFVSGEPGGSDSDLLLSDDWKVGYNK